MAPAVHASADKQRLGKITKQGNALLRWVLGQAAPLAARADDDLRRRYFSVMQRRGRPKAKVALARKLLVRLYIMLRDQIDLRGISAPRPGAPTSATPGGRHVTRTPTADRFPRQTVPCGRSRGDRWSAMTGSLNGTPTLDDPLQRSSTIEY